MPDTRREPTTATSGLLYTQWYHPQASKPSANLSGQLLQWGTPQTKEESTARPARTAARELSAGKKKPFKGLPQEPSKGVKTLAYKTEQQPQINQIQRSRCSIK